MRVLGPPPGHDDLARLLAASSRMRERAASTVARSQALMPEVTESRQRSLDVRLASRPHTRYAVVEGTVDGRSVKAVVRSDGTVAGDGALVDRANLIVALGDSFDGGQVLASLDGSPLAATLTLTRACDRVQSVEMVLPDAVCPPHRTV